jgi:DNA adenine methylase
MKPFLKWVGGKSQILNDVLALFPTTIHNYYEPFLGGGSVLLGLLSARKAGTIAVTGTIYASDLNANLIALYTNIQTQPDALIMEAKSLVDEFTRIAGSTVNRTPASLEEARTSRESYYYWIRSRFNQLTSVERTTPAASAMLLFLNKVCFRGVYREGPRGFNVPYGNYKNPTILDEAHIRAVSALLQGVVFRTCSFADALDTPRVGDFVYLDPPYAPESSTSFVSYTASGFGLEHHNELFKCCNSMATKGVKFLMSNADVQMVKDAFPAPQYITKTIVCKRAIHSKKPDSKTNEVLIRTAETT